MVTHPAALTHWITWGTRTLQLISVGPVFTHQLWESWGGKSSGCEGHRGTAIRHLTNPSGSSLEPHNCHCNRDPLKLYLNALKRKSRISLPFTARKELPRCSIWERRIIVGPFWSALIFQLILSTGFFCARCRVHIGHGSHLYCLQIKSESKPSF